MNTPYKTITNIYSHTSVPWQQEILNDFLEKIVIKENSSCIDVGTGIGNNLSTILNYCRKITAVDISDNALKMLRKRYNGNLKEIIIKKMDAQRLNFPAASFDLVICTEILEHCLNPQEALSECLRVLKPGGYIVISSPNYLNLSGIVKLLMENIYPRKTWDAWGNHDEGIENFLTSFRIKKWARNFNIEVLDERGGDLIRSWAPFLRSYYEFIDHHPILKIGKQWPMKMLMMNYFMLARKRY